MKKKYSQWIKIVIIGGIFSIIGALIQWFFSIIPIWKDCGYQVSVNWDWKTAIWHNAQVNEYKNMPTSVQEERERIVEDDKSKILGFFSYWNAEIYDKARNNIHSEISWIFTNEKMLDFRKELTKVINIKTITLQWEIWNSQRLSYTKNVVDLEYTYQWKKYEEIRFIKVIRQKDDTTQHHIKEIRCIKWDWPLCKNFSQ